MKRQLTVITFILSICMFSSSVFAYSLWNNKAKLINGVQSRYYYVSNPTYNGLPYGSWISDAVTEWNNDVGIVSFGRHYDNSDTTADFYITDYGFTNYNGVTLFYKNGEGQIAPESIGPSENYDWAKIKLNNTYLYNDYYKDTTATAKHEFGHALGLAHSSVQNAIMYKDRSRTTRNVESDDISGINALY